MKKLFTWAAVCLCIFTACDNKPEPEEFPEPDKGVTYSIQGSVNSDGFNWSDSSVVGLYSDTEGVKANNLKYTIDGYVEGAATARFTTETPMDLIKGQNTFMVYYPWDKDLVYNSATGVILGLEIASEQTQPAANVAGDCFYYGIAGGIAAVDEFFTFTMDPVSALLKVNVTTSELAGYELTRVTLYDDKQEAKLGGGFNVNVKTGAIQTLATFSTISTTIRKPSVLESGRTQSVYINALPGDFTGKDIWIVVEMAGDKGVVTLPILRNDLKFEAGGTTEISLTDLKASDCSVKWFCPVENRLLTGGRYAYGEANSFFIQCKSGSTYTGAAYQANPAYPGSVTIDYRPRGDFSKVEDPAGCYFEWATNGTKVYTPRVANYSSSAVDPTAFEISQNPDNYTVTVTNTGAFAGAPILLMKKDGKILWAFTFWNIAADGTEVKGIPVSGTSIKLANLDLGTSSNQYNTWTANHGSGNTPDPAFRTTYYYQWGRPVPIFWESYWSLNWQGINGNVPALTGPMTLEQSIANPVGVILNQTPKTSMPNWLNMPEGQEIGNLWGNCTPDSTVAGRKSIYDPCPKGWRVADAAAFVAIGESCKGGSGFSYEDKTGMVGNYINAVGGSENLFLTQGYGQGFYEDKSKDDKKEHRLATMSGASSGTKSDCKYGFIWSNWIGSPEKDMPIGLTYGSSYTSDNNVPKFPRVAIFNRSVTAAVRCQIDEDNR